MTMEDAAELAWHVQQYGLTADALERFEAKRIPRVTEIVAHAKVGLHDACTAHGSQQCAQAMVQLLPQDFTQTFAIANNC